MCMKKHLCRLPNTHEQETIHILYTQRRKTPENVDWEDTETSINPMLILFSVKLGWAWTQKQYYILGENEVTCNKHSATLEEQHCQLAGYSYLQIWLPEF